MQDIKEVISLLGNDNLVDYQTAIEKIEHTYKELRDIKFALDKSSIVAITDRRGVITYINDKFCEVSQYAKEELINHTHSIVNSGYHDQAFFKHMWSTITEGDVWNGQVKNRAKDGSYYWMNTTIVPFLDAAGTPEQYISIRTDITEQKKVEEQIRHMAQYDELTGLANRTLFQQTLKRNILSEEIVNIAVIFLDLDRFAVINDTMGHEAGDVILKEVANRLHKWEGCRPFALASRYGGDEFVILLNNRTEQELSDELHDIQGLIAQPYMINREQFHLTGSMGVAIYPQDGQQSEELIKHADMAMYNAKNTGMSLLFHYKEHKNQLNWEMQLERSLHKAVNEESFELYYQPKVDVKSQMIIGTEALLRWRHESLGMVSPADFIPIAERSRLIIPIGTWVLKMAIAQNVKWHQEGHHSLIIAVNVSPIQLNQKHFVTMLRDILQEAGLPPKYLELEITEHVAMDNEKSVIRKLKSLQSLGVKVALDDFGTGYSSLKYLKSYGMNTLKIDQAFIRDYSPDNEANSLIPGIIALGHALGMKIVAEGVETSEQVDYLTARGCDTIQGYVYSRPVRPEELQGMFGKSLVRIPLHEEATQ
jgi:diguanylate cyclase (GGDEF)-like protein/PAS domain S-box-containing protein